MKPDVLLDHIFRAVDVFNAQVPAENRVEKAASAVIVGPEGRLDSLSIINFLVFLEEELGKQLGRRVRLMDESLIAQQDGPLRTLQTIASFVSNQT